MSAIDGDTAQLGDIADELETNQKLFKEDEMKVGDKLDNDFLNFNQSRIEELKDSNGDL